MITRSIGIAPGVPWGGPLPGGGYDGKTKRLDRAVQRFAEWLHQRIPGPVQVRFNSHRLSGGAFVYPDAAPDAPVTFGTPEIGLSARLITPASVQRRARSGLEERGRLSSARPGMGRLLDRRHAAALQRAGLPAISAGPRRPGRTQAGQHVRVLDHRHAARGLPPAEAACQLSRGVSRE